MFVKEVDDMQKNAKDFYNRNKKMHNGLGEWFNRNKKKALLIGGTVAVLAGAIAGGTYIAGEMGGGPNKDANSSSVITGDKNDSEKKDIFSGVTTKPISSISGFSIKSPQKNNQHFYQINGAKLEPGKDYAIETNGVDYVSSNAYDENNTAPTCDLRITIDPGRAVSWKNVDEFVASATKYNSEKPKIEDAPDIKILSATDSNTVYSFPTKRVTSADSSEIAYFAAAEMVNDGATDGVHKVAYIRHGCSSQRTGGPNSSKPPINDSLNNPAKEMLKVLRIIESGKEDQF